MAIFGTILIGYSCWNFFHESGGFLLTNNMLLLRYINEMALLNTSVNVQDYINANHLYNSDNMEIFIVDQLFNLKGEKVKLIDFEIIYDSYENIGLKTKCMSFYDQWLIDYSKNIYNQSDWKIIERQIIEGITESQINIDNENSWFDSH